MNSCRLRILGNAFADYSHLLGSRAVGKRIADYEHSANYEFVLGNALPIAHAWSLADYAYSAVARSAAEQLAYYSASHTRWRWLGSRAVGILFGKHIADYIPVAIRGGIRAVGILFGN